MPLLGPLPPDLIATRESLRAVACFAVSPARKAETGRIGLRSVGEGFGTPPFDDGTRIVIEGDTLMRRDGEGQPLTTVRDAADFLGVEITADPGVGHDLPPFEPDRLLVVDAAASRTLGRWWAFGGRMLELVAAPDRVVDEPQLWPEHFDLASVVTVGPGSVERQVNVGVSPGDADHDEPYLYVGPHELDGLGGVLWNEPFGASLSYRDLIDLSDPLPAAMAFVRERLDSLSR